MAIQVYNIFKELIATGAVQPLTADLRIALYAPGFTFDPADGDLEQLEASGHGSAYVGSFYTHATGLTIPTVGRALVKQPDGFGDLVDPPYGIYLPIVQVSTQVADPTVGYAVVWLNAASKTPAWAEEHGWTPNGNNLRFGSHPDTGAYQVG